MTSSFNLAMTLLSFGTNMTSLFYPSMASLFRTNIDGHQSCGWCICSTIDKLWCSFLVDSCKDYVITASLFYIKHEGCSAGKKPTSSLGVYGILRYTSILCSRKMTVRSSLSVPEARRDWRLAIRAGILNWRTTVRIRIFRVLKLDLKFQDE